MQLLSRKDVETGAEATLLFWLYFPFLAWAYVLDGSGSRPGWRYWLLSFVMFGAFCVLAHWWRLGWRFLWKRWEFSERWDECRLSDLTNSIAGWNWSRFGPARRAEKREWRQRRKEREWRASSPLNPENGPAKLAASRERRAHSDGPRREGGR